MGIVKRCKNCIYWYSCLVIVRNDTGFSCADCYCKFFELNDKPTFEMKLADNKGRIPKIIHRP